MNNFLQVKSNNRATPLRNAARIISIMILALLWPARGEAQADLDVSSITEATTLTYKSTSDPAVYAWYYKIGSAGEEVFSGKLTGTNGNCPLITIESKKEVTASDYAGCATLQLEEVTLTATGETNLINTYGTNPICIQTTGVSPSTLKYDGTTEYTTVILDRGGNGYNGGGPLILDAEKAELNIVATKVQSYGIYLFTTNISIKTILKGKINIEAWRAIHIGNSSYLSATPTAEIRCASYEYLYTDVDDRIKNPFLQWKFDEAPASGQPLEIRDASGNPLASPITFTTDGKAKSFAINVTKDTPYTLWLDGKKQKDSNGATSFTATESKYYEFTGITEFLAANWSEYGREAQVGPTGTDVAVDNTTYTVKTSAGLAWIAWVTNSGKKSTDGQNYPAKAGFEGCTVTLANNISLTAPTTGVVTSDFDANWPTIGEGYGNSFKGTFDGGSHKVSGLSITTIPSDRQYSGLFGYILNAEVKNLRVEGEIEGTSSMGNSICVGGIVGKTGKSKIIACSNAVEITVTTTATNYELNIGGIVGLAGDDKNSKIYSCWNEATLSGESSQVLYIGGIAGKNSAFIENCYSSGSVSGTGTSTSECASGGIVGMQSSSLNNCYATGSVSATATNSGTASAGGIAGYIHTGSISYCLALNAGNKISAIPNNGGSSNKGRIVGHKDGGTISDNYASTKIMLSDDGSTFTAPTTEIGANKINGADVYLDDVADAIADWTGSENTKAFTTIDTDEATGMLPQLKTVNYGTDGLPATYENSVMEHQLSLTTSDYLDMPTALELSSNNTETITLSCTDNKWSYKKGTDGESNRFNGTVKMAQSVAKSSNPLIVFAASDNPTLTFEKVNINSEGAALTINAGCTLTLNTTGDNTSTLASSAASTIANEGILTVKGKGLFIIKSATDTHYGLENSGTFTVDDPSATSVTFHCANTAIQNTGTLGNPWMEWRFAEAPAGDGNIAFAATDAADQSPAAQLRQGKTFATTVTAGKNYRVWTVDNSDTRILQQGKTSATPAASVISFKAPAEDAPERNLAVFTDVKDAVTVTVSEPTEGGSISVFYDNNLLAATDAIPNGATLTCKYSAIPGYQLSEYTAIPTINGSPSEANNDPESGRYQVPGDATAVAFEVTFTKVSAPNVTTEEVQETEPVDPVEVPTVVIPTNERPSVGSDYTIKLVAGDLEGDEAVLEKINQEIGTTYDKLVYAEIALVKENTSGEQIPIQPSPEHPVTVIYPYPTGTNSGDIFTIVHLKMNGTTEVYSVAEGNLENATAGLKFEVSSFSPFGIAWTKAGSGSGPDPGIDPEPTPVFFTVTLPAVEGVVTDPVAGSYSVEAGENFRFFLTLDKDYDESQPVVTTSRNETIEPFGSTSAYIIENIQSAVMITISGVRKNTAVSNATLDSGLRIRTESSALYIETDRRADIRIVSISGSTLASFEAHPGTTRHPLSPGIYIVKAENQVYKVIIN